MQRASENKLYCRPGYFIPSIGVRNCNNLDRNLLCDNSHILFYIPSHPPTHSLTHHTPIPPHPFSFPSPHFPIPSSIRPTRHIHTVQGNALAGHRANLDAIARAVRARPARQRQLVRQRVEAHVRRPGPGDGDVLARAPTVQERMDARRPAAVRHAVEEFRDEGRGRVRLAGLAGC